MRCRGLLGLALAGVLLAAPAGRADDKAEPPSSFKPMALMRVKALDDLVADLRYLFKQAGQDDAVKRLDEGVKELKGPRGYRGLNTKKAIGLYASVSSKVDQSQVILLLPVSDEKGFLKSLEAHDLTVEKGTDDVYSVMLPIPNAPPVLFRFANGYLYGTVKFSAEVKLPEKNKLPSPATVLAAGSGLLSLTANLDRLPAQVRKLAVSFVALQLGNSKDEDLPGETPAQKELRGALLDETSAQIKSVLEDGGPIQIKLDVNRQQHDLALTLSLAGRPGTPLAKNIQALARQKSLGAALLGKDSALSGYLNLALPEGVVKKLGPVVDDGFKKGLENLEKDARDLVAPLIQAMEATAKSGRLDLGIDLRGPRKSGKYTLLACGSIKDGDKIEAAFRKVVAKLPADKRKPIKLDADKADGINIHQIEQDKVDAKTKEMLGDGPLYLAIRKDAVLLSMGDDALATLKSALATEGKMADLVRLQASLKRMAKLIGQTQKGAEDAAKEAFKDDSSDKVSLAVTDGAKLEIRFNVKSAVLAFAGLMDKKRKE